MTPRAILDARMVRHTGIGRYVRTLIDGGAADALLGAPAAPENSSSPDAPRNFSWSAPIYGVREMFGPPRGVFRGGGGTFDVFHVPHYNAPILGARRRPPLVVTVHDLIQLRYGIRRSLPGARALVRFRLDAAVRSAKRIIAVSDATARDLLRHFPRAEGKVRTVHNGLSAAAVLGDRERASRRGLLREKIGAGSDRKILLYVGSRRPHKNSDFLFDLARRLRKDGDFRLALIGADFSAAKTGADPIFQKQFGSDSVLPLGSVSEDDLRSWYAAADALVFPSLDEGFGYPVLEAMNAGLPVLSSNAASLPEVGGDAALYFDPTDVSSAVEAARRLFGVSGAAERMAAAGRERAAHFSAERMVRKTVEVYREAGVF